MMLKSLKLVNIQSHKDTELMFDPGINVILGTSKTGKTGLLRGLRLVKDNKPAGLNLISYWDRDKKGQPKTESFAAIETWEGSWAQRLRTKDFNGYVVRSASDIPLEELEAAGKGDAPAKVSQILNMSDVNFQRQFDMPFLLSDSAPEVARFFNRLIELDLIDSTLSKTENKRIEINRKLAQLQKDQGAVVEELAGFFWIDSASNLIDKTERWVARLEEKKDKVGAARQLLKLVEEQAKIINSIPVDIERSCGLMDTLDLLNISISEKKLKINKVSELLTSYKKIKTEIDEIAKIKFPEIEILYDKLILLDEILSRKELQHGRVMVKRANYENGVSSISTLDAEIEELEKQLPDICPTCGQSLEGAL
jgi:hypothetical protein